MITILWPEAFSREPEELVEGEEISLLEARRPEIYRHLFRARRAEPGERLRLVDGGGQARWATVRGVGRKQAELTLGGAAPDGEPELDLALLVAPPKLARASWLVEKATEVGVREIRFLTTERAPRTYGRANLERLRRVAVSALQQCHGSRLPTIDGPHPWEDLESLVAARPWRRVLELSLEQSLDLGPESPVATPGLQNPSTPSPAAALAVGPEGGWAEAEGRRWAALGFAPWSLGERTLRVETAAVVACGAWLTLPGRGFEKLRGRVDTLLGRE